MSIKSDPALVVIGFLRQTGNAILLRGDLYAQVATSEAYNFQAFLLVALAAIATGIGSLYESGARALVATPAQILIAFVGWVVWTSAIYLVSTRLRAKDHVDWGTVARAVGFAHAPGLLRVFGVLPGLGLLMPLVALVWILTAVVVAVHVVSTRGYGTSLALTMAGFVPYLLVIGGLGLLVGSL